MTQHWPGLAGSPPAKAACIHFCGHPMANFVTAAQRLLPSCIKRIMKAVYLLLPPVWLQPHVPREWLVQILFLPSSLLIGDGRQGDGLSA
uniref:Uncharacterized protein n=1 Tax=Equus asinus TaxID=9793 RepID=A0A8C4MEF0_EQUAS